MRVRCLRRKFCEATAGSIGAKASAGAGADLPLRQKSAAGSKSPRGSEHRAARRVAMIPVPPLREILDPLQYWARTVVRRASYEREESSAPSLVLATSALLSETFLK